MVSSVGGLADAAAAAFDRQLDAAAQLSASMADAITAMRDAVAVTEATQRKYVEQNMMLDAATGNAVSEWSCNRTRRTIMAFTVPGRTTGSGNSSADTSGCVLLAAAMYETTVFLPCGPLAHAVCVAPRTCIGMRVLRLRGLPLVPAVLCAHEHTRATPCRARRRLAQVSAAAGGAGAATSSVWQGYQLASNIVHATNTAGNKGVLGGDDTAATDETEPARYVGGLANRNRLIGGLFLHTTRRGAPAPALCTGVHTCTVLAVVACAYASLQRTPLPHITASAQLHRA
jgi:hypothetical protein